MKFLKKRKVVKAIYEIRVDFNKDYKEHYGNLEKGNSYYFKLAKQERKTSFEEIKEYLINVIEDDMKKHLSSSLGIQINQIQVTADYNGSIELVFAVLLNSFQFIAGIKDFYDNIRLIRNYSSKFIRGKLSEQYGDVFTIDSSIEYPTIDRYYPEDLFWFLHKGKGSLLNLRDSEKGSQDGFFYYLLITNIVLIIIIIGLIYKAITSYYLH